MYSMLPDSYRQALVLGLSYTSPRVLPTVDACDHKEWKQGKNVFYLFYLVSAQWIMVNGCQPIRSFLGSYLLNNYPYKP